MFIDKVVFCLLLWHLGTLQTFKLYELSQTKFRTFSNKILYLRSAHYETRIAVILNGRSAGRGRRAGLGCWGGESVALVAWPSPGDELESTQTSFESRFNFQQFVSQSLNIAIIKILII